MSKQYRRLFFIGLCVVLASVSFGAEALPPQVLEVKAVGETMIPRTETEIHIVVESRGESERQAQAKLSELTTYLMNFLNGQKVANIQTLQLALEQKAANDFRGMSTISFEVSSERAGTILANVVGSGSYRVSAIRTKPSREAMEQAEIAAMQMASQKAMSRAQGVLQSLGQSLKGIHRVTIDEVTRQEPGRDGGHDVPPASNHSGDGIPMSIEAGALVVKAHVTMWVRY